MDVEFSELHQSICNTISKHKNGILIDKISDEVKLTVPKVNEIISELVIYGIVEETVSGYKLRN